MRSRFLSVVLLLAAALPAFAEEAPSAATPRGAVEAMIWNMKQFKGGKNLSAEAKAANETLRVRLTALLDIKGLGKLALEDQWPKLGEAQRERFYALFVPLVEELAYPGNGDYFSKVRITWQAETMLAAGKARVNTRILDPAEDVTVQTDFQLDQDERTREWRVVNVFLDGASLVTDYRNQFNTIIAKWGIQELFSRMEKKLAEIRKI